MNTKQLHDELVFSTSRSGGPGGQHVNKVETKVTLKFDIVRSRALTPDEKDILLQRLATQLTKGNIIVLTAQGSRSQGENKVAVIDKFDRMLSRAFIKKKVRKATKPSKSSRKKRLTGKKLLAEKKKWRQKL
ncbi:MAG: alternative ribosome rescue aminoacyl-tRNA hydrolase ArfB [Cytophagales bacterium]|nr:alternative ribosome rescue aminoacyl-tRNA hydrolase ArfB [Cytophagales bacterium]